MLALASAASGRSVFLESSAETPLFPNSSLWTNIDFQLNAFFWSTKSHSTALTIRVRNIIDIQQALENMGWAAHLYGKTLLDVISDGVLLKDHDDDFIFAGGDSIETRHMIASILVPLGFKVVRNSNDYFSLERYNRYVDIHFDSALETASASWVVHGFVMKTSTEFELQLKDKYGEGFEQFRLRLAESKRAKNPPPLFTKSNIRSGIRNPAHALSTLERRVFGKNRLFRPAPLEAKVRGLTHDEFLDLKIEDPKAGNWDWRRPHLEIIFRSGETVRDCIARLAESGLPDRAAVVEVDTSRAFEEPIFLSRRFWQSGNNFLINPLLFGFRHCVMPYEGVNTYVLSGLKPHVFSREYYQSLPPMEELEISKFLRDNPIEIKNGSVASGRHRVSAMIGRLLRHEDYIPFWVRTS
jgi:hypothetical protein